MTLTCHVVSRLSELGEDAWDSLLSDDYPFLRYRFLHALETSQAVGGKSGWYPYYIALYREEALVGAAPCYAKAHPYGEYVFDWSWAEAYEDADLEYYPKLICAVPFTPATGPRLLVANGEDSPHIQQTLLGAMQSLSEQLSSSGVHVLFPPREALPVLAARGFMERRAVQFHWFNQNFATFDDFLATLTARKRKNLRKERNRVNDQGIAIEVIEGQDIRTEHLQHFYQFYRQTYLKRSGHSGYLNQSFFLSLADAMRDSLVLMFATVAGKQVAGSLYFASKDTLFGRYWGCLEEYDNLHFELCYYQGIDYCIKHQLRRFDAGAQGEHKLLRGFEPVITYSAHWLHHAGFHQAIGDYLAREHGLIEQYFQDALDHLPFKKTDVPQGESHD